MKKILCIVLAIIMCLGLCSCESDYEAKPGAHEYVRDTNLDILPEEDPIYAETADMIAPVIKFIEYNHILNNTINYEDVGAEDFWNIVAIVSSAYPKIENFGDIDVAGVVHLKWDDMLSIAKTFLYKSWAKNQTPSYTESYAASANPGSGEIDLVPLGVDNFEGSLVAIELAKDFSDYDFVLDIDLHSKEGGAEVHHYKVYLASWEYAAKQYGKKDDESHIFPYMIDAFYYVGTDEVDKSEN
ncbi:MAG: hypothetical protein Q4F55_02480 [Bacillota bacterium]|nr:hypothetical protein [Bacillota bacterium]